MGKAGWFKVVNVLLFIFAVNQGVTGMGHNLFGEEFFEIAHPLGGILFIVCAIIHIFLNRQWIKSSFFKR